MITDRTIDELQNAVKTETITIDGQAYATRPVHRPPLQQFQKEPQPAPLVLHSLTALVEYIKSVGEIGTFSHFVHIESPIRVSVAGKLYGENKQRDILAVAQFEHAAFPFGSYQDNENFIVFMQSRFVATGDRDRILRVVGNLKEEGVTQRTDDGVTQTVVARAGIVKAEEVQVPNPVHLAPFRTFPEITQPVSPFVLRMRQGQPLPQCALFEADGGKWMNDARDSIQLFLKAELPETTILA